MYLVRVIAECTPDHVGCLRHGVCLRSPVIVFQTEEKQVADETYIEKQRQIQIPGNVDSSTVLQHWRFRDGYGPAAGALVSFDWRFRHHEVVEPSHAR
jgi:hypothetical protein